MEALSGEALLKALEESGMREKEHWRVFFSDSLGYDQYHGRVWRARQKWADQSHLFQHALGAELRLSGDWIVLGDVQLPTTDYDFAALPAAIARRYLKRPRQLLIVGDLMNMDSFSAYENEIGLPGFRHEVEAARALIGEWYRVFDRIVWLAGNHERRISKRSAGAILMGDLALLIHANIETSNYDRAVIESETGEWYAVHGSEYSVNQLTVADALAAKYRRHIISFHEHHCAIGFSRFGQDVIINGGGLFNQWHMAYVMLNTSKKPNMKPGFVLLKGGYPYLLSREPMTNWDEWLGVKVAKGRAA